MKVELMTEKMYNDILRGVHYLFKEYSPAYLKVKKSQAEYYTRNKERYIQRQSERYADPEEKQKIIKRATEWNRLHKF